MTHCIRLKNLFFFVQKRSEYLKYVLLLLLQLEQSHNSGADIYTHCKNYMQLHSILLKHALKKLKWAASFKHFCTRLLIKSEKYTSSLYTMITDTPVNTTNTTAITTNTFMNTINAPLNTCLVQRLSRWTTSSIAPCWTRTAPNKCLPSGQTSTSCQCLWWQHTSLA